MVVKSKLGVGTPSFMLLPANNYHFKIINKNHGMRIPKKGKYADIVEEGALNLFENEKEFKVFDDKYNTFILTDLTKVLFATKKYPRLEENQVFVPMFLKIEEKEIIISGYIVEFLSKTEYDKELFKAETTGSL